jgi:hypothetical protein
MPDILLLPFPNVIEDMSRAYDHVISAESSMNYPVAPGNVDYPAQFPDVWHKIVEKQEENENGDFLR